MGRYKQVGLELKQERQHRRQGGLVQLVAWGSSDVRYPTTQVVIEQRPMYPALCQQLPLPDDLIQHICHYLVVWQSRYHSLNAQGHWLETSCWFEGKTGAMYKWVRPGTDYMPDEQLEKECRRSVPHLRVVVLPPFFWSSPI
jgi:hypothetical protein